MDLEKMHSSAANVSDLLKLLGHPDRLMVLCQLKIGEQSVGELCRNLGVKQSPLSQHLARMRHEGVVTSRRDAQTMYYSITDKKIAQVIGVLYDLYCVDEEEVALPDAISSLS